MATLIGPSNGRSRRRLSKEKPPQEAGFLSPFESFSLALSGFFFRDNFLGRHLCSQVRSEALQKVKKGALRPAGVGRDGAVDVSIRSDHLLWLDKAEAGPGTRVLMNNFDLLRKSMNREFYLGLQRYEMQLALYPAGSQGYQKHLDAFRGKNERNRRLTAIYYLNPRWCPADGGELEMYLQGTELKIEPIADRLVVFFSERLEHSVLPTQAQRLALTSWFHA